MRIDTTEGLTVELEYSNCTLCGGTTNRSATSEMQKGLLGIISPRTREQLKELWKRLKRVFSSFLSRSSDQRQREQRQQENY